MATVEYEGFKFTGTAEECAAFAKQLRSNGVPQAASAPRVAVQPSLDTKGAWAIPSAKNGLILTPPPSPDKDLHTNRLTLRFLKAVQDHRHSGGISGEDLQAILSVEHPKGVGSRIGAINVHLKKQGIDPEKVYTKHRDSAGVRHWRAGADLDETIKILELI